MNSYKLNGQIGHLARTAIIKGLKIQPENIYKEVKRIDEQHIIYTKTKKYKLTLIEYNENI